MVCSSVACCARLHAESDVLRATCLLTRRRAQRADDNCRRVAWSRRRCQTSATRWANAARPAGALLLACALLAGATVTSAASVWHRRRHQSQQPPYDDEQTLDSQLDEPPLEDDASVRQVDALSRRVNNMQRELARAALHNGYSQSMSYEVLGLPQTAPSTDRRYADEDDSSASSNGWAVRADIIPQSNHDGYLGAGAEATTHKRAGHNPSICGGHRVACPSRRHGRFMTCINLVQLCDGRPDCPAGEDENPSNCLFYQMTMKEMKKMAHLLNVMTSNMQNIVRKQVTVDRALKHAEL